MVSTGSRLLTVLSFNFLLVVEQLSIFYCIQNVFCLQRLACCVRYGWSWVRASNIHQCLWTRLQVCRSKRLGCHVDLYTVSRCHTRRESENHTSEKACKGSTLALKARTDITRSPKQGCQWLTKRTYALQKFLCKKLYSVSKEEIYFFIMHTSLK